MVEFLENILALSLKQDLVYFHQSLAEEWLFFAFLIKKRKVFVAEENSGSHKWEILTYCESFPILVFEGSLSIEIVLEWLVKDTIIWLISVLLAIFISVQTLSLLGPCQRTYCSRGTQGNLDSPFSIDRQAHYPRWTLTGENWKSTYKVFVFYFHHPCLFYP